MFIAKLKVDLPEYNMKAGQYVYCDNVFTNSNGVEYTGIMVSASEMLYLNIQSSKLIVCGDTEVFEMLTLINKL